MDVYPSSWTCYASAPILKEEFGFCSAVMVFDTSLKPSGDLFCDSTDFIDPFMFVSHLQSYMKTLRGFPTRPSYILKDLTTCTHVCVRCDSVKSPLHPAYSSPFRVISQHNKYFIIDWSDHTSTASLGRWKASFLDSDYTTKDSFTKSPVSAPDLSRSLENGDQTTSQTSEPRPSTSPAFGGNSFKSVRFTLI